VYSWLSIFPAESDEAFPKIIGGKKFCHESFTVFAAENTDAVEQEKNIIQ
jgi:hypothetical protein